MIDLPRDIEERDAYPLVPQRDRWIFNKLSVAQSLGYECGPCGSPITVPGKYVQRPIMNFAGYGLGGVLEFDTGQRLQFEPPYAAGYFWCEHFSGLHTWTEFENDQPVDECFGTSDTMNNEFHYQWRRHGYTMGTLPPMFQGISKHLLVEAIGGKIIEVAPRGFPYENGRDTSYYTKHYIKAPWGNDEDEYPSYYWRSNRIEES